MLRRLRPLRPYLARYRKRYVLGFVALLVTQAVGAIAELPKCGTAELNGATS